MAPKPAGGGGLCLSMHQPWASLLVHGIKRIEGRAWPTEHRGRLWIHATSKVPAAEEVQELEAFYRGVHAMDGNSPAFPSDYPTGVLLGCVEVVDCLTAEQVEGWEGLPESLKLEVGSPYCFLCQRPQRLVVLHPMRGWPKIFELEKKMLRIASMGLKPPPSGSAALSWASFGKPPPRDAALPPSLRKSKFQERMVADSGELGKVARGEGSLSPRAVAKAAAAAAGVGSAQGARGSAGVPHAVALAQQQAAQHSAAAAGEQAKQAQQQAELDPAKRLRAVQKKLRQIGALEEKARAGGVLTVEEQEKLARARELLAEAEALQKQLS